MSDTTPEGAKEALEEITKVTKKGFNLTDRLRNRGLRKGTITLFLDEEKGPELGWAYDLRDELGNAIFDRATGEPMRERVGAVGDLELAEIELAAIIKRNEAAAAAATVSGDLKAVELESTKEVEKKIAELKELVDKLTAELFATALVIKLRAVPPVIEKDRNRRARKTLGIEQKGIPEDLEEEYRLARFAHLLTMMVQSVTDNLTGSVNEGVDYDDAVSLMDHLPPGQFQRLDGAMGTVQFTDSISRSIEGQEDFS